MYEQQVQDKLFDTLSYLESDQSFGNDWRKFVPLKFIQLYNNYDADATQPEESTCEDNQDDFI